MEPGQNPRSRVETRGFVRKPVVPCLNTCVRVAQLCGSVSKPVFLGREPVVSGEIPWFWVGSRGRRSDLKPKTASWASQTLEKEVLNIRTV